MKWLLIFCLLPFLSIGQVALDTSESIRFFEPSPDYSKKRFVTAGAFTLGAYTAFSVGFYNSWYKDYPMSRFHFFNDWGEWEHMDKAGHVFSGYFQALLTYKGARWTGMSEHKSITTGILFGTLFQSTIEVMDGFSKEWGFSVPDIAANTIGIAAFTAQQRYWGEQRITLKESAYPVKHAADQFVTDQNGTSISLKERANQLYGGSLGERLLKDYNAQTYWMSINVDAFLPSGNRWPDWLNFAVGYGAHNMYGGFENRWETDSGNTYDASHIERYHQFILGLDVDLTRINTKNHFLKTLFSIGNIFKTPSPAIEITSRGEVMFHFVYF